MKYIIIGIDEVGRGALAGPVTASAIAIEKLIPNVKDSKLLNAEQRKILSKEISMYAKAIGIESIGPQIIDEIGIFPATMLAMKNALIQCLELLSPEIESNSKIFVFIDGPHIPTISDDDIINFRKNLNLNLNLKFIPIPNADKYIYQVSCASIYAKHNRDEYMTIVEHEHHPQYNFKRNLGYPTPEHIHAIKQFGPCPTHRKTFLKDIIVEKEE